MRRSVGNTAVGVEPDWGAAGYNAGMLKRLVHWLIAVAVVLHLVALVFMGQSFLPAVPF
jgi:hypothetical protein